MKKIIALVIVMVLSIATITMIPIQKAYAEEQVNLFDPLLATNVLDGASNVVGFNMTMPTTSLAGKTIHVHAQLDYLPDAVKLTTIDQFKISFDGGTTKLNWYKGYTTHPNLDLEAGTFDFYVQVPEAAPSIALYFFKTSTASAIDNDASYVFNSTNIQMVDASTGDSPIFVTQTSYSSHYLSYLSGDSPTINDMIIKFWTFKDRNGNAVTPVQTPLYSALYNVDNITNVKQVVPVQLSGTGLLPNTYDLIYSLPGITANFSLLTYNSITYSYGAWISLPGWINTATDDVKLTLDEIIALFTFSHETLAVPTVTASVDYTGSSEWYNVARTHTITLSATDSAGNVTLFYVVVPVTGDLAPTITGPTSVEIQVDDWNETAFLNLFSALDTEDGVISVTIKTSPFASVANVIPGTYTYVLETTDSSDQNIIKSVTLVLVEEPTENTIDLEEPTIIEDIENWFKNLDLVDALLSIVSSFAIVFVVIYVSKSIRRKGR